MAAVDEMEPDATGCDVCSTGIGIVLREDPDTSREYTTFEEFYVVQVGDTPAKRLCADCASSRAGAIGERSCATSTARTGRAGCCR